MKKAISITTSAFVSAVAGLSIVASAHAQTTNLTMGHPFPTGHAIHQELVLPFVEELRERSDGRINLTVHPGGSLGAGPTVYDGVVSGAMDIGWTLQGYTPGRFPLTQIVEIPFLWDSAEQASNALWTLYEEFPQFQQEYGDVKMLGMWTHEPGRVHTKDRIVEEMSDMEGLRIRFPSPLQRNVIQALGATPVGMPGPDVYDGIERGVVDGTVIGNSGVRGFGLYEILDYTLVSNLYVSPMGIFMNQSSWDRLAEEDKEIFEQLIGERMAIDGGKIYDLEGALGIQRMEERGVTTVELSEEELSRWRETVAPVVENWIEEQEERGLPGRAMYERIVELSQQ